MQECFQRKPNTVCKICGKSIYRRPVLLRQSSGRAFCSKYCFGIFCRREHPCVICGKPILGSLHKKTCSRVCANKNRYGIHYKIGRPKDKAKTFPALKEKLLKIRGRKCERCSYSIAEVLQIHHRDRNRGNNSLHNLEVLCPNCHFEEHLLLR